MSTSLPFIVSNISLFLFISPLKDQERDTEIEKETLTKIFSKINEENNKHIVPIQERNKNKQETKNKIKMKTD